VGACAELLIPLGVRERQFNFLLCPLPVRLSVFSFHCPGLLQALVIAVAQEGGVCVCVGVGNVRHFPFEAAFENDTEADRRRQTGAEIDTTKIQAYANIYS